MFDYDTSVLDYIKEIVLYKAEIVRLNELLTKANKETFELADKVRHLESTVKDYEDRIQTLTSEVVKIRERSVTRSATNDAEIKSLTTENEYNKTRVNALEYANCIYRSAYETVLESSKGVDELRKKLATCELELLEAKRGYTRLLEESAHEIENLKKQLAQSAWYRG